jgi:hypothetical protein
MKIRNQLQAIHNFFATRRQVGHTRLAEIISKETGAIVIYQNRQQCSTSFNGVTVEDLRKMDGVHEAAILDNYVVLTITSEAIKEIDFLSQRIEKRDQLISTIKDAIWNFEKLEGKLKEY